MSCYYPDSHSVGGTSFLFNNLLKFNDLCKQLLGPTTI